MGSLGSMFGKGNSAPPAPNYAAAAQAQGASNLETARAQGRLSNPSFFNPYGSRQVTFNPDDTVSVNDQLSPTGQALFEQQNRIAGNLGNTAEAGLNRVDTTMSQPFDTSGLPQRQTTVGDADLARNVDLGTGFQGNIDTSGMPAANYNFGRGPVQRNVDFSGATPLPEASDAARQRVEQALYSRAIARLDPRFQQGEDQLRSNLVAQGLHEGTTAYDNALRNFNQTKNDAYSSAMNDAIAAGGSEQSRLFNLGMQSRQQGVGEALQAGGFANAAQGQEAGQNLQASNLGNTALDSEFQRRQAAVNAVNAALVARNAATLQGAQFRNASGELGFNQDLARANLANTGRSSALSEEAYLRQLPLTELNALRTGAQPQVPQFQSFSPTNVAGTPVFAATQAQGQHDLDVYNAETGQSNALMGTLGQLGSAYLMSRYFSDRRLKHKIRRVGTLPSGLPTYEFEYRWGGGKRLGVMAQDVARIFPEAVQRIAGFLSVDYGRIY